jgi:hypothetical protein
LHDAIWTKRAPDDGRRIHPADERDAEAGLAALRGRRAQARQGEVSRAVARRGAVLPAVEDVADRAQQIGGGRVGGRADDTRAAALQLGEIGRVERRRLAHLLDQHLVDPQRGPVREQQVHQRRADVARADDQDPHDQPRATRRAIRCARALPSSGTRTDAARMPASPRALRVST